MKASDHHAWLQYFTLGEIYKAMEKKEEAAYNFRKSLELKPELQEAERHLRCVKKKLKKEKCLVTFLVEVLFRMEQDTIDLEPLKVK